MGRRGNLLLEKPVIPMAFSHRGVLYLSTRTFAMQSNDSRVTSLVSVERSP